MLKIEDFKEGLLRWALSLLAINYIGYQTLPQWPLKLVLRIVAMGLIGMIFVLFSSKKIDIKALAITSALAIAMLFADAPLSNLNLIIVFLICYVAKDVSQRTFIKLCYQANGLGLSFYLALLLSKQIHFINYTVGFRTRNTMGFSNVNAAAQFFLSITIILVLEKNTIFSWLVYFILNSVVYKFTNSRTAIIVAALFSVIYLMRRILKIEIIWKIILYVVILVVFLSPLLIVILQYRFSNLNIILSERPRIFAKTLGSMSIKNILIGGASAEIDNGPICILLSEGVFVLAGVFMMFINMVKQLKSIDALYLAYLSAFLFIGMMEGTWIRAEILSSLVMWKILWDINFGLKPE